MPRKKAVRKKRRTAKKKASRKTTRQTRSSRDRQYDTLGRGLMAVAAVLGGIAIGWILVSWYQELEQPAGSAPPGLNVTVRGDVLVEIPTRDQVAAMSAEERERVEGQVMAALAGVADRANEPAPGRAMVIKRGHFEGADDAHRGSGDVELRHASGGRLILRLDEFRVTNGPSLHVYFVEDPDIPTRKFWDVGRLKGTAGSQNYEVSTHHHLQPAQINYVMIYDVLFGRVYATAALVPTGNYDDRAYRDRG